MWHPTAGGRGNIRRNAWSIHSDALTPLGRLKTDFKDIIIISNNLTWHVKQKKWMNNVHFGIQVGCKLYKYVIYLSIYFIF